MPANYASHVFLTESNTNFHLVLDFEPAFTAPSINDQTTIIFGKKEASSAFSARKMMSLIFPASRSFPAAVSAMTDKSTPLAKAEGNQPSTSNRLLLLTPSRAPSMASGLPSGKALSPTKAVGSALQVSKINSCIDNSSPKFFGVLLGEVKDVDAHGVPSLLPNLFTLLKNAWLDEPGLFRVSGSHSEIQALKAAFDSQPNFPLLDPARHGGNVTDPHALTGLIKLYLRELPDCLLMCALYDTWLKVAADAKMSSDVSVLVGVTRQLPKRNQRVLNALLDFLALVEARKEYNQMTFDNLAVCFAPTLLRRQQASLADVKDAKTIVFLVTALLRAGSPALFRPSTTANDHEIDVLTETQSLKHTDNGVELTASLPTSASKTVSSIANAPDKDQKRVAAANNELKDEPESTSLWKLLRQFSFKRDVKVKPAGGKQNMKVNSHRTQDRIRSAMRWPSIKEWLKKRESASQKISERQKSNVIAKTDMKEPMPTILPLSVANANNKLDHKIVDDICEGKFGLDQATSLDATTTGKRNGTKEMMTIVLAHVHAEIDALKKAQQVLIFKFKFSICITGEY